jgi:histidine ammonia-lyase
MRRKLAYWCRAYLDKKMVSQIEPIYGINAGFGSLCIKISNENLSKLQRAFDF